MGSRHPAPDDLSSRSKPTWPRRRRGCCSSTTRPRRATTGSTSKRFSGCPDFAGCSATAPHAEAFILEKATSHSSGAEAPGSGEREKGTGMRVLVTGHQGYLGTVMVPILQAAGHDVTGLDSGFFADCVLGPAPQDPPGMRVDLRDVTSRAIGGFRGGHPPRRVVQRSARRVGAADHLRHQPPRLRPVGTTGERGRRAEVSLRLHLLGVRGGGRGSGHRECSVAAADPVRGEQGPGGGRRRRDRGRLLLAGVPA